MHLSNAEQLDFNLIHSVILAAPAGTILYFRDFFQGRTASPRLARYLFEQVQAGAGNLPLRLRGKFSRDGYVKV